MATKTQKDYTDEYINNGKKALDSQRAAQDEQDAAYIAEAAGITNNAAQQTVNKYQQQIDNAPVASRALYDANALDEAISQKKMQESMANMGLTDSGLTSSMQTALAVQKSRADAGVRRQEREYVQGLETAIADVWAQAEAANAQTALSVRKNTNDSYNQALINLYTNAATAGATAYAADVEADAKAAEQANKLTFEGLKLSVEQQNEMAATVQELMKDGYSYHTASIMATQMYGGVNTQNADGSTNDASVKQNAWNNNYITAINNGFTETEALVYANAGGGEAGEAAVYENNGKNAIEVVDNLVGDTYISGWKTLWYHETDEGNKIIAPKVTELLASSDLYKALSPNEQEMAQQTAVADLVYNTWTAAGDNKDNYTRIRVACEKLGIGTEYAYARYEAKKRKV